MKRVLALLICLVMVLSLIPAAAAEDIEIIDIETGREDVPGDTGEEELIAIVDPEETLTTPGDELMATKPTITTQPASVKAYVGTTAKFTVQADGATGYQWYYRTSSSGSWAKSSTTGATTATLSVAAETRRSGYQYRCKVSNSAGYVYTSAATLTVSEKPVITQQPESLTIITGGTAKFTVKASGATAYQWYWRANKDDSWHKGTLSSASTATLRYTNMSSIKDGYQFKCKVSNDAGYVYSSIATLSVSRKPAITQQPESLTIGAGGTATFTVKADGATAYQWYWRANKDDSWHKSTLSTATAASLVCENMAFSKTGRQYKCKVSTAEGYVYSSIATLTVLAKPAITAQPVSMTIYAGGTATFTVEANGATAYQWYWRANKDDSWHKGTLTSATTATLVYKNMSLAKDGYQFKCKVSNAEGYVYSKIATLTVSEKPVITTGPLSFMAGTGATVKFKVEASGANSYQWQYRTSSSDTWKSSSLTGCKTDTLTVSATTARNGYAYRCVLKNANGTVYSKKAVLTVVDKQCGKNLTWTLDSNGLLTISGTGKMYDFKYTDKIPWYYCDQIRCVTIDNGVTSIGDKAFCDCSNLTSVTIPDGVTSIGDEAFCGCESLTGVTIPNSVTSIGDEAFSNCESLTGVTIPDSVTSIGYYAFYDCYALQNLTIGSGVTRIQGQAFMYCISLTSVTIPDSVTSIGAEAFEKCISLTSVTIPDSVMSIEEGAFDGCNSLTSVTIGKGLTIIEIFAFNNCSSLKTFTVASGNGAFSSKSGVLFNKDKTEIILFPGGKSGAYTIPDSVTSIGNGAFCECSSLTSIIIPDSVTSIGYDAFCECSSLTSIIIPDSVTSIGDSAFSGCSSLTSIIIPDSVTSIGDYAFYDCSSLTSVTIGKGVTSIGWSAFKDCSRLTSVTIPDSVTSIGDDAFFGCSSLTSIIIPDSVTSIGDYAFRDCSGLTSVTIPDSVTSIGGGAFWGCSSLTSITIPNGVTSIGWSAFEDCSRLTSVTIGKGVTSIEECAFRWCSNLSDVYYKGTKTQWNKIEIGDDNDPLLNATIHYNA